MPMDPPIKIRNGEVGDWRLQDEDFLKHFTLPGAANKHDKLAELNPLPRDGRILFDEACARACMHGGAYRRHKAKALTGRKWLLRWLASDRTRAGEIARPE